jgi:hypothetical protein
MDWLGKNASAIQAIASIITVLITLVLAVITAWYALLTRRIARTSAEQVRHMREMSELGEKERKAEQRQSAKVLGLVAERSRLSITAHELTHASLRVFNSPTESDLADIDSTARLVNNANILINANRAIIALRHILGFVQRVKNIPPQIGWIASQEEQKYWSDAVSYATKSLNQIENDCKQIEANALSHMAH